MLFNSGIFLQFFAAFLLLYWLVRNNLLARNLLIVASSYLFYGWWNFWFLGLLVFSSLFDFCIGIALEKTDLAHRRKTLLAGSIAINLCILGFFKYFNFFADSFSVVMAKLGFQVHPVELRVILPIGISFYTFQSMGYAIDVYRREIRSTRDLVGFLAFVSFFPQLVAGPIQRARQLLPQFHEPRRITRTMIEEGIWLSLWGMFKKVALADNLAPLSDMVFQNPLNGGPMVVLGTIAFGFQIYYDFSGYSDIARGVARLLGFEVMQNFRVPYAAQNPRDFWTRWHISLSTWLRDYLYISLGGNRRGPLRTHFNLILTMLIGGLWHGAAWNFVLWGVWHGIGLSMHRLLARGKNKPATGASGFNLFSWLATMLFVFYGWLLFRARSLEQIITMTKSLAHWEMPIWIASYLLNLIAFILPVILVDAWLERAGDGCAPARNPVWTRTALQGAALICIFLFWENVKVPFIYFQF
jgi:D-alanyl-lipoteichoic acid acyltransferase DltB (MBOAT superfamily)